MGRMRVTFAEKSAPGQTPCYRFYVRKNARVLHAAVALVLVGSLSGAFASACSSDAVGVEACQQIEAARCESTTACGVSDADSQYCVSFYRDQCLHGLAKGGEGPDAASVTACVDAIRAVAGCARAGATSMAQCPTIAVASGVDPTSVLPCAIIKQTPQVLGACAFLDPDANGSSSSGAAAMPDASSDGG